MCYIAKGSVMDNTHMRPSQKAGEEHLSQNFTFTLVMAFPLSGVVCGLCQGLCSFYSPQRTISSCQVAVANLR